MPFGSLPTGTFSSPFAGKLTVRLSAQYFANTYLDAGFPSSGGGEANLAIRGYAGPSGSPTKTPVLEKFSGFVEFEMDYPGGSVAWPCGVEQVAFKSPGGSYTVGFQDISLSLVLRKK